jgi:hypothetical protein
MRSAAAVHRLFIFSKASAHQHVLMFRCSGFARLPCLAASARQLPSSRINQVLLMMYGRAAAMQQLYTSSDRSTTTLADCFCYTAKLWLWSLCGVGL